LHVYHPLIHQTSHPWAATLHIGFHNAKLRQWIVDIASIGSAFEIAKIATITLDCIVIDNYRKNKTPVIHLADERSRLRINCGNFSRSPLARHRTMKLPYPSAVATHSVERFLA
jgi:hypothetical protein